MTHEYTRSTPRSAALTFARRELFGFLALAALGCKRSSELSAQKCREHLALLSGAAAEDVAELRRGLPAGAQHLREYFAAAKFDDAAAARAALDTARNKVQDLRVAKATFFALVDSGGIVIRSDQGSDLLAGKNLFAAFPELRGALQGGYRETRGEMAEAARVKGKDGQWVAAQSVDVAGAVKGLYVAGWSWSAYAYRLENALRSHARSALKGTEHEPLIYVYMAVDKDVFGAPASPLVNAQVIRDKNFFASSAAAPVTAEAEITGRDFGIGFQRAPILGENVAIVVLRSET